MMTNWIISLIPECKWEPRVSCFLKFMNCVANGRRNRMVQMKEKGDNEPSSKRRGTWVISPQHALWLRLKRSVLNNIMDRPTTALGWKISMDEIQRGLDHGTQKEFSLMYPLYNLKLFSWYTSFLKNMTQHLVDDQIQLYKHLTCHT